MGTPQWYHMVSSPLHAACLRSEVVLTQKQLLLLLLLFSFLLRSAQPWVLVPPSLALVAPAEGPGGKDVSLLWRINIWRPWLTTK